ncbi:hypothetical protein M9458_052073 [Cirrhinus mrigala]|uniref:B30.2/SPRY domain-containing protein n=1 Tax=Cirrhinus mrigala TaxID=683832 RepID=A0ABD0MRZ1_CIRMR
MSMATLRLLPSSRKGFMAATARRLGDLQVTVQNVPPGKTLRASAPPRGPLVMPKQAAPPPKSRPSVSFGAPQEDKMSISASEEEQSADEADVSAGRRPCCDAELSAMLLRANREKSKLSPVQRIFFLGMELDSVNMTARLTNERTQLCRHKTAAPGAYGSRSRSNTAQPASYETASALATRSSPEMGMAPVAWTGPRLLWHINCLELLAVLLALRHFLLMLRHKHVLVRTDNTATVAYINRQGGLRSRHIQTRLKSLHIVHIPGDLNCAANQLSRPPTHPGEWRLHPQTVQLIWSRFGEAQIDLFASPESSHCQLYYSLSEAPLGRDALAHSWPPGPNLLAQTLCKIREDGEQVLLVAPYWPTRPSLEDPPEEGPSFSGNGHNLAPASRPVKPTRVASGRDTVVVETITQQAYALRTHRDARLQEVGAQAVPFAAYHDAVDGTSIGKHQLVVRFRRGARRINPPRPHLVPSWDLSVALQGLRGPPFEPLVSVELKFLSLKTALLTTLASIKRVGDLQAFSVNEACLEFGPADSHVVLRPGCVPKVPTTPFRDQVVNLQALPPEEADPALALLCPVHALRIYVDRTRSFRRSEQLFICFGGQQKGNAVSKQRLAHWVVDAISLAYEGQGELCPLGVRAHSTQSVASSYALVHGASLADICRAAGWATPNTFARFYNLRVEPVSSHSHQLTLNLNTVNKHLYMSERNRLITATGTVQSYPDHPDRFDHVYQVLCRESVCGRCYWEIEWSGDVCISVSYKSISRKGRGDECVFGCNDQSWSLICSRFNYSFRHDNIVTILPVKPISRRIGVYVDHCAGTLSFYSVSDTMNLIHTVQTTFTQPLYPGFTVYYRSSAKLC